MQKYLKVHFFNMSTVERMIPNRDMLNLEKINFRIFKIYNIVMVLLLQS